ncbi:MAG: DUF4301 family protein [Bacteroidales bacterium]|jgi:hypothetical protein|nr:DUF4301 family protein [Bacteroidales bacterium]
MFSQKDIAQIEAKGMNLKQVEDQIKNFKSAFPFIKLKAAATPGKGLKTFNKKNVQELIANYSEAIEDKSLIKFVPASGAASRMFKHLFEFREELQAGKAKDLPDDNGFNSVSYFFEHLEEFAFYSDLKEKLVEKSINLLEKLEQKEYLCILNNLLDTDGLEYASLPKGLLKFHSYDDDGNRLAIEEHLVEGAVYGKNDKNKVNLHFTVSPEHLAKFEKAIDQKKYKYAEHFNVEFLIKFSQQKPSTDTISVDLNNEPFREKDGSILFRPGGHGALIENLNDLGAEIIFIKNIDNIVPDKHRQPTYDYKKLISSYLIEIQDAIFDYLESLEIGNFDEDFLNEIFDFMENTLFIKVPKYIRSKELMEQVDWAFQMLNRPIRVCGMVKNEGETGGGPFLVEDDNGMESLQIVESSQIDFSDQTQADIVKNATHFNPVDLVCGIYDYKGDKFDLKEFVDPKTGFISVKSKNGKNLKAQELPGLWNGAMADWISIFVEVPIDTFNPVKIINDLLRPMHQ